MPKARKVKILGRTCTIKSDEEENHVNQIVGYINEKVEEVLKTTVTAVSFDVLVLTALNIANDYFKADNKNKSILSCIENRSISIINTIESQS